VQLITNLNTCIDPAYNLQQFYDECWLLDTAIGYGLDCWGRRVGVNRVITVSAGDYLGFTGVTDSGEGASGDSFNSGIFYSGQPTTGNYSLTDDAFRQLILAKAAANITNGSTPAINAILLMLFPGRGNCFPGDTEILTDKGFRPLRLLSGDIRILSPVSGEFETAVGKCYGRQRLNKITINCSWRNDRRSDNFIRFATPSHRWILQNGSTTEDLKVGDILQAGHSKLPSDPQGWVHGLVFGDGSRDRPGKYRIRLCGLKKRRHLGKIRAAFPSATVNYPPSAKGDPIVRINSKYDLKAFPEEDDPSYIRGFVEGLLAADGCFYTRGRDAFQFHGSELVVRWLRDRLVYADYAPCGKAFACADGYTNLGRRTQPLWKQQFRRTDDHKGFRVVGIESAGEEDVFCVEEPKYHQLTMRDGLRSSNCYVQDNQDMTMVYVFEFPLQPFEVAIVTTANVLPTPAGVFATIDIASS
jgi:hypothetical protein